MYIRNQWGKMQDRTDKIGMRIIHFYSLLCRLYTIFCCPIGGAENKPFALPYKRDKTSSQKRVSCLQRSSLGDMGSV